MSCFGEKTPEAKQSSEFDKQLSKERKILDQEVKLLLLGAGESGKSTVFKQMKIIQKNRGFNEEEKASFRLIIVGNCITQMKVLINAAKKLKEEIKEENQAAAARIVALPTHSDAWDPPNNLRDVAELWKDPAIKRVFEKRDISFQLNDSAEYFFDRVENYIDEKYIPVEQDVLRARVRTTGIDEAFFTFDDLNFRMIDVGGQRTERRKWIHCFEGVTSILFCASLSEYDQKLREDNTQNRMQESLSLFAEICNSTWFRNTSIMLFLNKIDIFKEKIPIKDPKEFCFPEYTGGCNYDKASAYIKDQFIQQNSIGVKIYPHFTCAVDTGNILFVFKAVKETIVQAIVSETGIV